MPSQTKYPTLAESTGWANPTYVLADDANRSTYNSTLQADLIVRSFDFTIPANATILGITVNTQGQGASGTAAQRQVRIGMTKDGSVLAGTRKTGIQYAQSVDTDVVSGGAADLWGTTWTPVQINSALFGVLISDNDTTAQAISIDLVTITVTYSIPAFPTTDPTPCYPFGEEVEFKTQISEFEGPMEQRHSKWANGRHHFNLKYENMTNTQIDTLWDFYKARKGRGETFTLVNPRNSVSHNVRFKDDMTSREWFAADLHRIGLNLIETFS